MSSNRIIYPLRGEIWWVNFDPTIGSEIQKKRPALVISSDALGAVKIRTVVPITGWKPKFENCFWRVKIEVDEKNNLEKDSALDVLQVRGVSTERFDQKIGVVSAELIEEVVLSLAAIIEYP